jgi:hypothetical protein
MFIKTYTIVNIIDPDDLFLFIKINIISNLIQPSYLKSIELVKISIIILCKLGTI